jgi:RNA polymerase sigma-70 factor (ECF subfamily)
MRPDSEQTRGLVDLVRRGDKQALAQLLVRYRPEVHAYVDARLDPRVRARESASDVVQMTLTEVARRMDDYLRREPMPFHVWVRRTAHDRLDKAHRFHRQKKRSVDREEYLPRHSSLRLARPLLAPGPGPDAEVAGREFARQVSQAVARLGEADQEILLLRHVDDLPFDEIAGVLGIEPAAARRRYGRALLRLRKVLAEQGLLGSSS